MVYEHALCVDGVLAPCAETFKVNGDYEGPPPTVALLATDRQIRDEALPVLFGRNTWRITSGAKKLRFRYKREGESDSDYERAVDLASHYRNSATLLGRYGRLIRKVVLDCNFRDVGDYKDDLAYIRGLVGNRVSGERLQCLHDLSVRRLINCWTDKQDMLFWMCKVTSIVIDISHLSCSLGCCRLDMIEDLFGDQFMYYLSASMVTQWKRELPTFEVQGTFDREEEVIVEKWVQGWREAMVSQNPVRVYGSDELKKVSGTEETNVEVLEDHEP